jgi:hypothetical protein
MYALLLGEKENSLFPLLLEIGKLLPYRRVVFIEE